MKKPSIAVVPFGAPQYDQFSAIEQNIEIITGRVGGKISPLGGGASLSDVVNKLNEIIDKLQS